jgi:hypothetical protein
MAYKINKYFLDTFEGGFVDFFDKNLSGKAYFTGININETGFSDFWSEQNIKTVFGRSEINIVEFLTLHNIIAKETGGQYARGGETVNGMQKEHPGIGYLYDRIGKKMSYNAEMGGNKTCQALFVDSDYIDAHGAKPLGDLLAGKDEPKWGGKIFPYGYNEIDNYTLCSTKEEKNGFILQADFFKFRGRGFIQTTGRANYKGIVEFIIKYNGSNQVIMRYKKRWADAPYNNNVDKICTRSTNEDWDILFRDMEVGAKAINLHSNANPKNKYLNIDLGNITPSGLNQKIWNAAKSVNNGREYANLITNQVLQTIQAMGL